MNLENNTDGKSTMTIQLSNIIEELHKDNKSIIFDEAMSSMVKFDRTKEDELFNIELERILHRTEKIIDKLNNRL